jgi:DNA replication factor GINS
LYADLYKAWKAEKTFENPQPLAPDFYRRAAGYMKGLEDESATSDTRTIQGRLLVHEKEMAQRLLEELKATRLQKIVNQAKDGHIVGTDGLTDEEKGLAIQFNESLASFKQGKLPEPSPPPEEHTTLSVVRFLSDVPEIVGVDLRIYGPYKREDVGSLPEQNVQALVRQGLAKEIDVRRISQ